MKNFFISYNKADRTWAEWIAWHLEEAGYTTVIQAWDFRPGSNLVLDMQKAATEAERTIAVLSPNYLTALYTQPEWAASFAQDPTGEKGSLLPVRVQKCDLKGLLPQIVYIDLVGLEEEIAKKTLLEGVHRERAKPKAAPGFPGAAQRSVAEQPRFPGVLPSVWNVPHNRNPNFTGRDSFLTDLRMALTSGQPAALTQAISGLGGVGKTQLAVEYAHRHATEYDVVWWVRAEEPATLAADYASLAGELGLWEKDVTEQAVVVKAVRQWLGKNQGWLLVFDNAGDPADVRDYLPQGATGHVIITSRNPNWGGVANPLSVKKFERAESVEFLCKRTGQADEPAANNLAEALGDLPLALAQAGAYIETTGRSLSEYLNLFCQYQRDLLSRGVPSIDYPNTVATTWEISFQQIQKTSPAGANLMNLCAFLAPDSIPLEILNSGAQYLPQPLAESVVNPMALNDAVSVLRRYSLIEKSGDTLSVHRLVQAVVRDRLEEDTRRTWAETALRLVKAAFESYSKDTQTWPECSRLLSHALLIAEYAEDLGVASEVVGDLLNQIGGYLRDRAQFEEAEAVLLRALVIRERAHGKEHPDVAQSLNDLGTLYRAQGKYRQAEPLYKRVQTIYEKAHGPDHPYIATTLNNLGLLYKTQGEYNKAEPLYKQALAIWEKTLGPDDLNVGICLNNLGELYRVQSRYDEAKSLYEQAWGILEKAFGSDNPQAVIPLNNLAALYYLQDKYEKVESLLRQVLTIWEKAFGPNHINVAICLDNLAVLYRAQDRYTEAEPLHKRALAIFEKAYGPVHPEVATCLENMSELYEKTGRKDEAEKLKERAKGIRSRNQ